MDNFCEHCKKTTTNISKHLAVCLKYKEFLLNKENNITYEYLYNEYIINNKSINYISKQNGFKNNRNIEKLLIKYNIPIRTQKEANNCLHKQKLKKQTNLKKYGTDEVLKSDIVKNKIKNKIKTKYNVTNISQIPEVKNKKKNTFKNKYNTFSPFQLKSVKLKYFEKTGYDNPWKNPEVIKKCLQTKYDNGSYNGYYSPISQELFWKIYDRLPEHLKQHTYFAELNKEFGKYDKENNKYYFYDFVIVKDNLKFCIEYNGNFYHANPKMYNEKFLNKHLNLTAKEIWDKDKIKNDYITNLGFDLYIIWESDDIDQHIENIINIINENI